MGNSVFKYISRVQPLCSKQLFFLLFFCFFNLFSILCVNTVARLILLSCKSNHCFLPLKLSSDSSVPLEIQSSDTYKLYDPGRISLTFLTLVSLTPLSLFQPHPFLTILQIIRFTPILTFALTFPLDTCKVYFHVFIKYLVKYHLPGVVTVAA